MSKRLTNREKLLSKLNSLSERRDAEILKYAIAWKEPQNEPWKE